MTAENRLAWKSFVPKKLWALIGRDGRAVTTMSAGTKTPEITSTKDAEWHAKNGFATEWMEDGIQGAANKHPEQTLKAVRGKKSDTITCMDGRTHKEGKVACAGCGLALLIGNGVNVRQINKSAGVEDAMRALPKPVQNFIASLKKAGVINTESHRGCGAGDMYATFYEQQGWGNMTGDEAAREWAVTLATLLGGKHKGHAEVQPKFHNERAAYYSFSDSFNPAAATGIFLPGYVISRGRYQGNHQQAVAEMNIAFEKISFTENGYGKLFTRELPFFFVVVARNKAGAEQGRSELQPLVNKFDGRVQLQTIVIP